MIKYSDFHLRPNRDHKFMIIKDIKYKDLEIKRGFTSNGGNIPRIFWSIFPPNETTLLPIYIIHDYLCDLKQYKKADKYLLQVGKELSISPLKLYIIYFSVRLYHIIRYDFPSKIKFILNKIKK